MCARARSRRVSVRVSHSVLCQCLNIITTLSSFEASLDITHGAAAAVPVAIAIRGFVVAVAAAAAAVQSLPRVATISAAVLRPLRGPRHGPVRTSGPDLSVHRSVNEFSWTLKQRAYKQNFESKHGF